MTNIIDGGSNTRLIQEKALTSHCDYGRWHREDMSPQDFEQLLLFLTRDHVVQMDCQWSAGGNALRYDHKVIGIKNFVGGFSVNENKSITCMIQCPGQYWEQMNNVDMWHLFQGLKHRFKMKPSRVDYAIDDPTYKIIPVDEMWEAANNKNNWGFRKIGLAGNAKCGEAMALTRYFGSRESSRFTRIYDHDGECLRHETEFKRGAAQQYFDLISDLEREDYRHVTDTFDGYRDSDGTLVEDFGDIIARRICGAVTGAIDFRTKDAYKDQSRVGIRDSERLGFYQQYIDKTQATVVRIKSIKPVKSLEKTYEWIKRQCAPTLAMFREGLGRHGFSLFMQKIVDEGEFRMDNLKHMWVKEMERKPTIFQC